MKFLLETVFFVVGLVTFLSVAFLVPSLFWIGFAVFLVFAAIAFVLGFFRRQKNPVKALEEEIEQL
jgi:membrane protein implicated in regulation of membrane protease activity